MIQVNGLTKYYGNRPAAKDISFEVEAGEVFGLLGTNGAGKSYHLSLILLISWHCKSDPTPFWTLILWVQP